MTLPSVVDFEIWVSVLPNITRILLVYLLLQLRLTAVFVY